MPVLLSDTESGDVAPVAVGLVPLDAVHVAVYPVMLEPPLEAGAENASETEELPDVVAPVTVGAPGTVRGVAAAGVLQAPAPTEFTAATRKV
jgi:hypothetical protein